MYRRKEKAKHRTDSEGTMAANKAELTQTEQAFTGSDANGEDGSSTD